MSPNQKRVLTELGDRGEHDEYAYYTRTIASSTGLDHRITRLALRALSRKGVAELVRGLMSDDGYLAGSGYRVTDAGRVELARPK